ncbi:alpha/beta hydrolase [Hymenobacter wooponensis]|nr:alpha/beta hydrolase [Hymenobacter wooponensis]
MSFLMRVVRRLLRLKPNAFRSVQTAQASAAKRGPDALIPRSLRRRCHIRQTTVQGQLVFTLTPQQGASSRELVYIHGGGFIHPLVSAHWSIIKQLIRQTGATITVPIYGLTPAHHVTECYTFLDEVYQQAVTRAGNKPVYLAGDSAGGNLSLGLAIRCRDQGQRLPTAVFLFSPALDLTLTNPEINALLPLDPMLDVPGLKWCFAQWAGGLPLTNPLLSPLYDSLVGLPPIYLYQGGYDILAADARTFAAKAKSVGAPAEVQFYPDGFHVFVGATFTKEARQVFRHIGQVVNANP